MTGKLTKVAVHQMCSSIDPKANASGIIDAISRAGTEGAAIYFAPEMSLMLDRDRSRGATKVFEESKTPEIEIICAAAAEAQIWVHLGSLAVRSENPDGRFYNRSIVIDDIGKIRARYDKMHLFDVNLATGENWRESNAYEPGAGPAAVKTPLGTMGLTICYDMRFPDLYSVLSKAGVDLLAVPAAFTVPTGRAHWHTLLRARAIEAEAFVVAAAQSGKHEDGRETYGHSLVIDPWGEILLDMGEGEGLGYAEINLDRLTEVRAQIPVGENRREIPTEIRSY